MNTLKTKPITVPAAMGQITKRIRRIQERYLPLPLIITEMGGVA